MLQLTDQHESGLEQSHRSSPLSIDRDSQALSGPIHLSHSRLGLAQRLPHELLAEIFLIGLDTLDLEEESRPFTTEYLIRLTAVCAFWRVVAVSTSTLWAKIRCTYYKPRTVDTVAAFLEVQLERSNNVLLDVWLTSDHWSDKSSESIIAEILYPHLHRCHTITLQVFHEDATLLLPLPGPLKNLISLTVRDWRCDDTNKIILPTADTPLLHTLQYQGPLTALLALQTNSLKHINLHCDTLGQCVDFVSRYPDAESVVVSPVWLKHSDVFPKAFSLDKLTFLGIPYIFCTTFQHIFKAPKLEELVMWLFVSPYESYRRGIQILPFQSLKRVTLIGMGEVLEHPRILYDFVASHPSIEQFTLRYFLDPFILSVILAYGDTKDNVYWTYIQEKEMGLPENYGPLLPSLTVLRFEQSTRVYGGRLSLGSVTDLLKARPVLSFSESGYVGREEKVWLDHVKARFGHRFTNIPYERPQFGPLNYFGFV